MNDYNFGNYLYELRKKKGLSQFQLGALLGVSDKAVSKWENGITKPQIKILEKLSKILEVSIDELISSKEADEEETGIFYNKKLWYEVFNRMTQKYGDKIPFNIDNRFSSEYFELTMSNQDAIIYLLILKKIKDELEKTNEFFKAEGYINSLLIPYIMGITNINPLGAHYYCPNCKKVEFVDDIYCCWDLSDKACVCGSRLIKDGHNIPFETAREWHFNRFGNHYQLLVSQQGIDIIIKIVKEAFGNAVYVFNDDDASYQTIIAISKHHRLTGKLKYKTLRKKADVATIAIRTAKVAEELKELETKTGQNINDIQFEKENLTDVFRNAKGEYERKLLSIIKPQKFSDLIKIESFLRCNGVWKDNGENLIANGKTADEIIAFREDIFQYILKSCDSKNTGTAHEIMFRVSKGKFINGIPNYIMNIFEEINVEEWFIESIKKIKYLFPKTFGIANAQYELAFYWYKRNYPEVFKSVYSTDGDI